MNEIDLRDHPSLVPRYVEMRNRYVDLLLTEPVTVEGTARWLRDGKVEVRCLLDEGSLAGSVILYLDRDGEVAFFAGEPGKGIGSRLLAIAENVARDKGLGRLWARVLTSNEPARRAFLKAGYELDGTATGSWRDTTYEVHILRRRIPGPGPAGTDTAQEGGREFIPFALPSIGEEEIAEVTDSLRSGWLTTGPKTKRFEEDFARAVGAPHALAVNSGTAAMHLALEAIGLSEGEYVVTTPYTFTATAEVIRYFNAHPLFADIDPETGNIDPGKAGDAVERALAEGKRVRAILPVHFGGRACPMDSILSLARKYSLKVVEDAAHAFPCSWGERKVGAIGDLTCFSFYVTKTIATGEGGMVTTADGKYAGRIRTMRLHGIGRDVWDRYSPGKPNWYYEVVAPGYKYNLGDLASAIGIHQLRKAERLRARREAIARRYAKAFPALPVRLPGETGLPAGSVHAWHLYVLRLEIERLNITRDRFIERMAERGIGTSVHFIPLHLHPYWREKYSFAPEDFPESLDLYRRCVSLPIYPGLSDAQVDRVVEAVTEILSRHAR